MEDKEKTKGQLLEEIGKLRTKIDYLKQSGNEQKLTDDLLTMGKDFPDTLLDNANTFIIILDTNADITLFNQFAEKLTGYKKDEVLGKNWFDIFIPKRNGYVISSVFKDVLEEMQGVSSYENLILCKNGSEKLINWENTILKNELKEISGILSIGIDITERKQAEEELQAQKKFIDNLIENSALSTWISDDKGTAIRANPACLDFFGATTEEVVGKYNIFKDEVLIKQGLIPELKKVFEKGEVVNVIIDYNFGDVRHVNVKDATHKIIKSVFTPITDKNNKVINAICQTMDLTDIKKAETALKESEEKYRVIAENAKHIIITHDLNGKITYANDFALEFMNITKEEVIGQSITKFIHSKEDMDALKRRQRDFVTDKKNVHHYELKVKNFSGENRILEVYGNPIINNNNITSVLIVAYDITDRKKAEQELIKLSTAVRQSPSEIAITDLEGNLEYVNPKFTEITGYTFEEAKGTNPRILKSGKLSDEVYIELWKTISSGNEWRGEFQNKKKNGELYWEAASISPIFNKQGNITNFLKVAEDITNRKEMEEELRKKIEDLEIFNDAAVDREIMINELRREINEILVKLGKEKKYDVVT